MEIYVISNVLVNTSRDWTLAFAVFCGVHKLVGKSSEDLEARTSLSNTTTSYNSVKERAKYIPLRLSLGERKMLRLVEAAM